MKKSACRFFAAAAFVCLMLNGSANAVGYIDVKAMDHGPGQIKEVHATGYIAAPPAKVWRVLVDYGSYAQFMPHIASSKLENRGTNLAVATMHLSLPFPFQGTWYTNRYQENPATHSISWRMVNGSLKSTAGGWTLKAQGNGTMASYTVQADPGIPLIPKALQDEATRRTVPDIFAAVERRALSLR